MPITSDTPVVIAPAPAPITYDTWWVVDLHILTMTTTAFDGTSSSSVPAIITYRLGRMDTGIFVAYVDDNGNFTERRLSIPDIFVLASTDADVASAITALVTLCGTLGKLNGTIS